MASESVLEDERLSVALAWLFVGFLLFAVVESLLSGEPLWAGFAAVVAAVALAPPAYARSARTMAPPELLGLAALPVVVRSAGLYTQIAGYAAVTTLALLFAVELDVFTEVEMTAHFAVAFVVVTTLAVAGGWTVVRYFSDVYLGTAFFADVPDMMWDLVTAAAVGLVAGGVFELYFRRHSPAAEIARDGREELQ
ncbi:hypothetical protein G9464_00425 [Halostella sp. JP-L12]|uniref:hypothetical protein n=1 Tax=Halostella TaxID=1843185 RepID=UPI000EF7E5EE|nr:MULTISPECIES: hypothetical protein [Halostella]NHN46062.1 hypothetical protein [Halostella sp. JP-L12]